MMWWSTFETSSVPSAQDIDATEIKKALIARHRSWKDPVLHDIINNAEVQSIYPTWTVPELPHWGEKGIVLVGDACHAMDPTTGQGASQGLEDSKTLAILIAKCLERERDRDGSEGKVVNLAIRLYHEIRKPRVAGIVEYGKKMGGKKANVGPVFEYVTYFFLWLMMSFPSIGKSISNCIINLVRSQSCDRQTHARRRAAITAHLVGRRRDSKSNPAA
jgi:2-polyprenyl-6-methoxyphenol hydroxylase-like FAD-dependent oxidoreductase